MYLFMYVSICASLMTQKEESTCNAVDTRDMGLIPGSGRCPGGENGNLLQSFLPEESHGQRSLVGYYITDPVHNANCLTVSHCVHCLLNPG